MIMVNRIAVILMLLAPTACQRPSSTGSHPATEKVAYLELQQNAGQWMHLDCTKPDFVRLLTDVGTLFVSCEDATPHLGGFRLKLSVGNPWAVTYKGLNVKLTWSDKLFDPPDKVHRSSFSLTRDFPPGTWTSTQVVIAPASVDQLRTLTISIEPNQVSLREIR
jgi:hypothetical protein